MSLKSPIRVNQTSSTAGLAAYNLNAATSQYKNFRDRYPNGANVPYLATDSGSAFECGVGVLTYGSPDTITRNTILSSSNSNAAVNWAAGLRNVFAWEVAPSLYGTTFTASFVADLTSWGTAFIFTGSSTAQTATLPALSSVPTGYIIHFRNAGTQPFNVVPNGTDAIDAHGAGIAVQCATSNGFSLISDLTVWRQLGGVNTGPQLLDNRIFDAATSGTVPAGTMVSLTRTGTVIDRVAPFSLSSSQTILSTTTGTTLHASDMGGQVFVVAYIDTTNASSLTLIACSVAGSVITQGVPVVISASTNTLYHTCKLSSTLGIVAYADSTNASTHTVKAFSLSGLTITIGAAVTTSTSTNTAGGFSLWRTSATTFILNFIDSANSSRISAVAGSVSGTTITVGAKVQVSTSTNAANNSNVAVLTGTSFVITFTDSTNSNKQAGVAGSLSGNTITLGSIVQASGNTIGVCFNAVLDSTHFVSYTGAGGEILFWLVAGTVLSLGTAVSTIAQSNGFTINDRPLSNIITIDATHALIWPGAYISKTGDLTGTVSTAGFTGTDTNAATFTSTGAGVKFAAGNPSAAVSGIFSGTSGSYSIAETVLHGTFSQTIFIPNNTTRAIALGTGASSGLIAQIVDLYGQNPNTVGLYGITTAPGSANQSVPIAIQGIVSGLSGLTQMKQVFANGDGSLNVNGDGNGIGFALDANSLVLRQALTTSTVPVVLTP